MCTAIHLSSFPLLPLPIRAEPMPSKTSPQALHHSIATAEGLKRLCETTPGLNAYQPIVASVVEVCAAAASAKTRTTDELAAHIVQRTALLVPSMAHVPIYPEILQSLEVIEQKLDAIRRHIERTAVQPSMKVKLLTTLGYTSEQLEETSRLKEELENHLDDLVSLNTYTAGATCEAPGLNFLKLVVGIAMLICDTAMCVKSNHDAAVDLAKHASIVTKCIVERVAAIDPASAAADHGDALEVLKLVLGDIQVYLTSLSRPRRRYSLWLFANQEKDRFLQLHSALDEALATFSATECLRTAEDVHATIRRIQRLDSDANRTLTKIHADLDKLAETDIMETCLGSPMAEIQDLSKQWVVWGILSILGNYQSSVNILFGYLTSWMSPKVGRPVVKQISERLSLPTSTLDQGHLNDTPLIHVGPWLEIHKNLAFYTLDILRLSTE
ncbi:hypothetical protein FB451DRAFT_1561017 [Mycena latifolia]|nr:hypothetical protein FB451DRAFT_1561017 [Mycena latifolia]